MQFLVLSHPFQRLCRCVASFVPLSAPHHHNFKTQARAVILSLISFRAYTSFTQSFLPLRTPQKAPARQKTPPPLRFQTECPRALNHPPQQPKQFFGLLLCHPLVPLATARASHCGRQVSFSTPLRKLPTCLRSAQGCITCVVSSATSAPSPPATQYSGLQLNIIMPLNNPNLVKAVKDTIIMSLCR